MLNSSIDCILSQEQMQIQAHMGHGTMSNCVEEDGSKEDKVGDFLQAKIVMVFMVIMIILVIIVIMVILIIRMAAVSLATIARR